MAVSTYQTCRDCGTPYEPGPDAGREETVSSLGLWDLVPLTRQ